MGNKIRQKNDWAGAAAKVALRMIGTGNVIWLCITVVVVAMILRMQSGDLRAVIMGFMGWPWFAATGWILFVLTLLGARWANRRQAEAYQMEMDRMAQVRNAAMQEALALPLSSSRREVD